ncbi:hypothetical protein KQX54_011497 [Cotesia glomerata]|uniref:Uncharacterized protein n=1 Tax=Cotesia glomerata TaxID=32391 RepID=A0AAV7J9G1_COTGL|nr:hypothetical protein KQX54_011497 [Cotesia glomerata]
MLHSSIQKLISVRETSAINILDRSFYSALLWAIKKKRIQVVKWLLENGASLYRVSLYHHTDNRQYLSCTILHMAALWYCGNQDEEIVRILIHHSEDINATILCNSTALHIAVRHDLDVDLNMKDEKLGFTALYYAAKNLDTLIVSFLLNNGADIHVLNNYVRCELLEFLNQFPESNIIQLLVDTTPVIFYHSYTLHFDRFFGNIIKQHIIKSKIANLLLDPHFSHWQEFYSQSTIDKFSSECIAEIELLKQEKICNTSFLSYHHFLTDDVCRLTYYTRNSVLKKNFKRFQLSIKFPIYGQMIINYFHRARHRLKLILNFETVLADILCHFPTNFVCSISDYLSEEELSMF